MGFIRIAAIFLGFLLVALPASAESFSDMATNCGSDPTSKTYSKAEYAKAYADATRSADAAKKRKDTGAGFKIGIQVNRLKECEKQELAKFPVSPFKDCPTFIADAKSFFAWAANAKKQKYATDDQIARIKDSFKPQAEKCLRQIMENCIDPQNTLAVLNAVDAVETARKFIKVPSLAGRTGLDRASLEYNPFTTVLKFCSDTDFACKGRFGINCADRVPRIKSAFESWLG